MDTAIQVGLCDISDPEEVYQPFLDDLKLITGLKVTFGKWNPNTFKDVARGDLKFGTGLTTQSGIPAMKLYYSMPFGMEGQEFISWLYNGEGLILARDFYASRGVVPIPFRVTVAEGGGWFTEELTKNYLKEGDVKMRLFGFGGDVLKKAFPNVEIPPLTPGATALEDFRSGALTALELGFPTIDKQQFFDIPKQNGEDTIFQAGATHYYIGSWWQSYTYSEVWINKDFYDSLKQKVRDKIDLVSRAHVLRSLAETNEGQGAAVKFFQNEGVTVWDAWPEKIRKKLRKAAIELINERSDNDPEWAAVVDSMKTFVQNEQTRWAEANEDRRDRFEGADWSDWESIIQ